MRPIIRELHVHVEHLHIHYPPTPRRKAARLYIRVDSINPTSMENPQMHTMRLGETATLRLDPRTEPTAENPQGFPAELDTQDVPLQWQTGNAAVVTITPAADGKSATARAIAPGDSRISAIGDADLDAGQTRELTGILDIHVAAEASTLGIVVDTPTPT